MKKIYITPTLNIKHPHFADIVCASGQEEGDAGARYRVQDDWDDDDE